MEFIGNSASRNLNYFSSGQLVQHATLSLDAFKGASFTADGPFNSATGPSIPVLGFTLIASPGGSATVTVSNLHQFTDGVS